MFCINNYILLKSHLRTINPKHLLLQNRKHVVNVAVVRSHNDSIYTQHNTNKSPKLIGTLVIGYAGPNTQPQAKKPA